jgi:putative transposase
MKPPREIPDELWEEIQKIIPPRPDRSKGGRKPADDRVLFNGIFFVLRTGAAWREMPEKYGPWTTVYDRFREWRDAKVFEQLWAKCLRYYEQKHGIIWEWQSSDGTYVRSPLGGKENGPNPTDRAKPGMKDHVLVDGRGVPLSVAVTAANINDHIALPELLKNYAVVRPRPTYAKPQHICLDAAFDNELARQTVCREYHVPHIAPKGGRPEDTPQHSGGQAHR